jgi:hypothetical protein
MFKTICFFRTYFVPHQKCCNVISDDKDKTIVTLNVPPRGEVCAPSIHPRKLMIPPLHAVADTGAR